MRILVIGGTRNLGHDLVVDLHERGHRVTVLNRGQTPDELPRAVERLRADRSQPLQFGAALAGRSWDAVVDFALYTGPDARTTVDLLDGRIGHYVFISTGQVYLVRADAPRPAREADYPGPLLPAPAPGTRDHANWLYGMDKRAVEDALVEAHAAGRFPFTSLRLPMVNSARDHYGRLYGYLLRVQDGGPIVVPGEVTHDLRHVYGGDVVRIVADLVARSEGKGEAWNLSHDETLSHDAFLALLAGLAGAPAPEVIRVPLAVLETRGLFPASAPFADTWMSALDNTRSREILGIQYTPFRDALEVLVEHHRRTPRVLPAGYLRREDELLLAREALTC
jgi:nucleoside-diphosphate-sugar epimerase